MVAVFKNNASTTLASAMSSGDTTISVTDASVFPVLNVGDFFNATIQSQANNYEIVRVTAIAGNALTVTRAQEDTLAIPFQAGSRIELRTTKVNLEYSVILSDYLIL